MKTFFFFWTSKDGKGYWETIQAHDRQAAEISFRVSDVFNTVKDDFFVHEVIGPALRLERGVSVKDVAFTYA